MARYIGKMPALLRGRKPWQIELTMMVADGSKILPLCCIYWCWHSWWAGLILTSGTTKRYRRGNRIKPGSPN